jgi:hypothetical protein
MYLLFLFDVFIILFDVDSFDLFGPLDLHKIQ